MTAAASPCFAEQMLATVDRGMLLRIEPAPAGEPAKTIAALCRDALAAPVRSETLDRLCAPARRIAVVVSDATRDEPRAEMLEALFEFLPPDRTTLVVASGTHAASEDIVPEKYRGPGVVVHCADALERCVDLGTTAEGTRVRILEEVALADLVVVTGRLRPHYFAGYSGGVKGVFPGCGYRDDVLANHRLKADPTARLGRIERNRCRADMEEAALRTRGRLFILNVLADCDGAPVAAVSGDAIFAHRKLAERAHSLFSVEAPKSRVVVVADRPPITRSLYQASKLLPPASPVLEPGGSVVLVAECDEGVEPLERVNEGIYRLGIAPSLPRDHRVVLVSTLDRRVVERSYARYAPSLAEALGEAMAETGQAAPVPVLWRAGELIVHAREAAA